MFSRHTLVVLALLAAVGIPYLSSAGNGVQSTVSRWWSSLSSPDVNSPPIGSGAGRPAADGARSAGLAGQPRWEGPPLGNLAEVFNFDVTVPWITSRWRRVSTALAAAEWRGYRVPLVSGTRDDDLAGSLTYYFDRQQRLQRITFHGTTGDPRKLVSLVSARYNFRPQQAAQPGTIVLEDRWNGKPRGQLVARPSAVVTSDARYARYELDLLIGRQ